MTNKRPRSHDQELYWILGAGAVTGLFLLGLLVGVILWLLWPSIARAERQPDEFSFYESNIYSLSLPLLCRGKHGRQWIKQWGDGELPPAIGRCVNADLTAAGQRKPKWQKQRRRIKRR